MINNNGTTGRQGDFTLECRFNLTFYLITREQGDVVIVEFNFMKMLRHDSLHEVIGFFVGFFFINNDFCNIRT